MLVYKVLHSVFCLGAFRIYPENIRLKKIGTLRMPDSLSQMRAAFHSAGFTHEKQAIAQL